MSNMQTTPLDHMPADFSLETLKAHLTDQEIAALQVGDDPAFPEELPPAEAAPVVTQQPAAQQAPVMPVLPDVPDTTAAKATVDAFDAKLDALQAQFDDGEMDTIELRAAMKALAAEQAQAQALIQQAQAVEKIRVDTTQAVQQTLEQQWNATLDSYQKDHPELWAKEHVNGWDAALKAVTGSEAHANLNMAQCVAKAHEVYRMNYTAATGKVLGAPKLDASGDPIPKAARTDPREPLQTLAGINGEPATTMNDGTFAVIDRTMNLSPERAEDLVRALSAEQADAFFREDV